MCERLTRNPLTKRPSACRWLQRAGRILRVGTNDPGGMQELLMPIGSILCSTDVLCLQGASWYMRERFFESGSVESIRSSERV
jgi:hypothetical protein